MKEVIEVITYDEAKRAFLNQIKLAGFEEEYIEEQIQHVVDWSNKRGITDINEIVDELNGIFETPSYVIRSSPTGSGMFLHGLIEYNGRDQE